MMRALYSAISGLKANQTMMDVVANNLANVNTVAYKSSRVTFRDMLSEMSKGAAAQSNGYAGSNSSQIGLGVTVGSIDKLMGSGATQSTGNPTDVMIAGEGFFRVGVNSAATPAAPATDVTASTAWTTTNYTRAGNFTPNNAGYLTTADGYYVIGKAAVAATGVVDPTKDAYINIPPGSTDTQIGPDGRVSYTPAAGATAITGQYTDATTGRVTAGFLSLAKFPNAAGLDKVGGNRYAASAASGAAVNGTAAVNGFGSTNAGSLEMSNVDMATEFTSMITAQRGFQANARVITTGDSMLEELVNLKR
jgi:flagellar hook protein FlgE